MTLAQTANDIQAFSKGRFLLGLGSQIKPHIVKRFSMEWSHPAARMREFILALQAIWDAWNNGTKLDFRGDFYSHTLMTPFFNPGPERLRPAEGVPGRRRRTDDRGGGRGGRRLPLPRVHHRGLSARRDPSGARTGSGQEQSTRWTASRSPDRPSSSLARPRRRWLPRSRGRANRSRSTGRRPRIEACSSTTAGAGCRTS